MTTQSREPRLPLAFGDGDGSWFDRWLASPLPAASRGGDKLFDHLLPGLVRPTCGFRAAATSVPPLEATRFAQRYKRASMSSHQPSGLPSTPSLGHDDDDEGSDTDSDNDHAVDAGLFQVPAGRWDGPPAAAEPVPGPVLSGAKSGSPLWVAPREFRTRVVQSLAIPTQSDCRQVLERFQDRLAGAGSSRSRHGGPPPLPYADLQGVHVLDMHRGRTHTASRPASQSPGSPRSLSRAASRAGLTRVLARMGSLATRHELRPSAAVITGPGYDHFASPLGGSESDAMGSPSGQSAASGARRAGLLSHVTAQEILRIGGHAAPMQLPPILSSARGETSDHSALPTARSATPTMTQRPPVSEPASTRRLMATTRSIPFDRCLEPLLAKLDERHAEVCLDGLGIGDRRMQSVAAALAATADHLRSLRVARNRLTSSGTIAILQAAALQARLTVLDLSANKIEGAGADALCSALACCASLRSLALSSCGLHASLIRRVVSTLLGVRASKLESLRLDNNDIGSEGGQSIGDLLSRHDNLEVLDVSWSGIHGLGATAVAQALRSNDRLRDLDVSVNRFGATGAVAVALALETNTTLERLALNDNDIGPQGTVTLASILDSVPSLQHLELSGNSLGRMGKVVLEAAQLRSRTHVVVDRCTSDARDFDHPAGFDPRNPVGSFKFQLSHRSERAIAQALLNLIRDNAQVELEAASLTPRGGAARPLHILPSEDGSWLDHTSGAKWIVPLEGSLDLVTRAKVV